MDITSLMLAMGSGLLFSVCVIFEKYYLLSYFDPHELVIFRRSIYPLMLIPLLIFAPRSYKKIKNMPSDIIYRLLVTIVLGFAGLVLFWHLLRNNKSSHSVTFLYPFIIIFTIMISHFLYNEAINKVELMGILFALMGIMIIGFNQEIMKWIG